MVGRGNKSYDWATLEDAFVKGTMKIIELSREHTKLESSPPYPALRKRAAKHKWREKREQYNATLALLPKTEDELKAAQKLENRLEKLVDAAEVVRDHLRLSKTLKGMYAALGMKVRLAIEKMHPEDFSTSQVLSALNTLASLMHAATELERKSLNLADPLQQVELTTRYG